MINWDKPLECEHGAVNHLTTTQKHRGKDVHWVMLDSEEVSGLITAHWHVYEDGTPIDGWMPRVYNKKPEPKTNEYWLCESDEFSGQAVLRFHGSHWESAYEEHGLGSITPIDKMERVEG